MSTTQVAFPAQNTVLKVMMGSPLAYETIPNLGTYTPTGMTSTVVDVSSHSTDEWTRKVPTMIDGGKISAPLYYIPGDTVHEQLITYLKQRGSSSTQPGVDVQFRVDFPNATQTTYKFKGFVTGFKLSADVKGVLTATLDIDINGEPDFAATRDNQPLT